MNWLLDPFSYDFFVRALVAGAVVGGVCGAVGVLLLLRRMSYVGHGLSYGMVAGVAAANLIGLHPYGGALIATAAGSALIDRVRRVRGIGTDAAIAIVSTVLFAVGVAILSANRDPNLNLENLLFGNILGVQATDIVIAVIVATAAAVLLFTEYKPFVFTTYDPLVARSHGIAVGRTELLFNLLVGAVVIASLRVVGVLLITAVIVLPAATARLICVSLNTMLRTAAMIGIATSVVGLYASYHTDIASGPAIVLANAVAFILAATGRTLALRRRVNRTRRHVTDHE